VGGEEGVGMEAGEVEGVGGQVKWGLLVGEGVPLMLATWMHTRVMRAAVPIPAVAAASMLHSAAVGGSVVGDVGPF